MVVQYYIVEIQQYQNGEYGHIVHVAWDNNPVKARLKADSKYHEVLAAAAISDLPSHAAIMFGSNGYPVCNEQYVHVIESEEVENADT